MQSLHTPLRKNTFEVESKSYMFSLAFKQSHFQVDGVCALHAISGEKAPRSPLHSLLLCCCDLSSSPADTHTINLPCFSPLLLSKMKGLMWLTHRRRDATPGRCTVAIILQSGETFWQRWDVVLWFYWTFFKCIFSGKPLGWANMRSASPWKTSVLLFPIHVMKAWRICGRGQIILHILFSFWR